MLVLLVALVSVVFSCNDTGSRSGGGSTPTDAYKKLYAAVKAKDTEAIKSNITKKTIEFAEMVSQRNNTPLEKVFENGFTATTFAPSIPEMRDERVSGDMGALEVWNAKDNRWEDLAFIREDGSFRLAVGEQFAGTYQRPGIGRDQREKEAANAVSNTAIQVAPPVNTNIKPIVPRRVDPPAANSK